ERALFLPVDVLDAQLDVGPGRDGRGGRGERDRRREEQHGPVLLWRPRRQEVPEVLHRGRRPQVHLPVAGNDRRRQSLGHAASRSSSIAMPGNVLPSRNSSDAPPPVETWESRSANPASSSAAAVSPPPAIVVAPLSVASATARATPRVP